MPKALVPVGSGADARPLIAHALRGAGRTAALSHVVVVAPPGAGVAAMREAVAHEAAAMEMPVQVVGGGAERADSVAAGLAALPHDIGIVLVHDAARAFTPPDVFDRVVHAVRGGHAAVVPALPVTDTVKQVRPRGAVELVEATPDRSTLRAVQTPQGFLRETLERAHAQARGEARHTDDAGMVEATGGHVAIVPGDPRALKVTTPQDLDLAARWVAEADASRPSPGPARMRAADRGMGSEPVLVVLSGLPGVGKTTVARALCRRLGAAHLRVDTVEQALVRGGIGEGELGAAGYAAALAVADDQLAVGLPVVADLVNAAPEAREAWEAEAVGAGARLVRVVLECSDEAVHRRRVEERRPDLERHRLPTWAEVRERAWEPWEGAELTIDTARTGVEDAVALIEEACR